MKNILNHNIPFEKYFEEISRIPRGSGNEGWIAQYLIQFAKDHNLRFYTDSLNNVVIYKQGSPGYEKEPPVIMQAHMDMVCVKEPDCDHDFYRDPLDLVLEGNILRANGTSLGADNGTGVATILALLSQDIACPPIEAFFTASEEAGMKGAAGFDYTQLTGRRMIAMDSGGENHSSVNAAACETVRLTLPVRRESLFGPVVHIHINGLLGGHSGSCIDMERYNAIKIATELMREYIRHGIKLRIAGLDAGTVTNAIPTSCDLSLGCDSIEQLEALTEAYTNRLRQDIGNDDPGLTVVLESFSDSVSAVCQEDTRRLLDLLTLLPTGRRHKSTRIAGFTTASSNLGTACLYGDTVCIGFSMRANTELKLTVLEDEVSTIARLMGATLEQLDKTPCWEYQPHSAMRAKAAALMPAVMGVPLVEEYEHGGLECGYFASHIPGLDIYVIGPVGREVHSTKEWLDLESAHRVYNFLVQYLAHLKADEID